MKSIVALVVVLTGIISQTRGQKLAVGYRTGVNQWLKVEKNVRLILIADDGPKCNWNNEVFIRMQITDRLSSEIGIGYNKRAVDPQFYDLSYGAGPYYYYNKVEIYPKVEMVQLYIQGQYKIEVPKCLKANNVFCRLHNYVGIGLVPMIVIVKTESRHISYDPIQAPNYTSHAKDIDLAIGAAINHTMMCKVTKDINITSTLSLKYVPSLFTYYSSNAAANFNIGISYNLK